MSQFYGNVFVIVLNLENSESNQTYICLVSVLSIRSQVSSYHHSQLHPRNTITRHNILHRPPILPRILYTAHHHSANTYDINSYNTIWIPSYIQEIPVLNTGSNSNYKNTPINYTAPTTLGISTPVTTNKLHIYKYQM